ncbi:MAG: diguanylate cyclase [Ruminiclostridium sp.]|nr:diguanylate cyclase [Ruminiclostridium sp.]
MMNYTITVYAELKDERFVKALKEAFEPQNIILDFSEKTDGAVTEFPEDHAHLVITDDPDRIRQLTGLARHNLRFIFIGKMKLTDELEDVWDTDDPEEITKRFERMLGNVSASFNAWFYEQTLYTTIDTVPDMLWYKRLDGMHMMVNKAFTEIVHKKREDIIGRDHFYIWDAPRPAEGNEFACAESEETAIRTGKTYICDEPVKTREGMKQFTTYKTPVFDMFGNVFGTVGVGHDVTNFSNLGIELSILVENLPFPMVIFTADMKVVKMNEAFMKIAGLTADEAADFDYESWKTQTLTPANDGEVNDEKHYTSREYRIYDRNSKGESIYVVTMQEIRDFFNNVSGYFLLMNNVTVEREYEESMFKAANTDMLTGMYNRRYFYNYLSENTNKPMTLFYMDLDRFKYVNDHYGHAKGDEVLIRTSQIIKTRFPKAVSARLGGDEFALVVDGILSEEDIKGYCSNIENTIQRIFTADALPVTMSIGVVTHDGSNTDVDEFMNLGDQKMYEVKKQHHEEDR